MEGLDLDKASEWEWTFNIMKTKDKEDYIMKLWPEKLEGTGKLITTIVIIFTFALTVAAFVSNKAWDEWAESKVRETAKKVSREISIKITDSILNARIVPKLNTIGKSQKIANNFFRLSNDSLYRLAERLEKE